MTEGEFSAHWVLMCEMLNHKPSAFKTRSIAVIMKAEGITAEQWARGCTHAIRHEQFFPTVQELINWSLGYDFEEKALLTWDKAVQAAARNEASGIEKEAKTILMSATSGQNLGMIETKRIDWIRSEFVKRYTKHLATAAAGKTPNLLSSGQPSPMLELEDSDIAEDGDDSE
jgi:hypothetical protein